MWKNGSGATSTSSAATGSTVSTWSMLAMRLRWLSITPLLTPVVPLEYGSAAMSATGSNATSGAAPGSPSSSDKDVASAAWPSTNTSQSPACPAAWRATSRNGGIVSSILARQSASWWPSSRTVYNGLAVVQQPPEAMAPWKAIAYSGTLGRQIANLSPLPNPRALSPAARLRTDRSSSA